jgi:molecular chaperone DnaK
VIEVKNDADNLVYQIEKALRDLGDKVHRLNAASIETKVNELKQAAQGDDIEQHQEADRRIAEHLPRAQPADVCARSAASLKPAGGPSASANRWRCDRRRSERVNSEFFS